MMKPQRVMQTATVNVLDTGTFRDNALLELTKKYDIDLTKVHAVRPLVTFAANGTANLTWEIETLSDKDVFSGNVTRKVYHYTKKDGLKHERTEDINLKNQITFAQPSINVMPVEADSLAANELHHLVNFQDEAKNATIRATTTEARAYAICNYVGQSYGYDGNIFGILDFTWADILTRDLNGRRGVCDEYAVVQVSMLRSLGIPARLKYLTWQEKNPDTGSIEGVGHAVVEYQDGNLWFHMDGLWGEFHNPGAYRARAKAFNVTVMDADYPLDSRSTAPSPWGMEDPTGDLKINYYGGDFILTPSYPGERRPGYSY